jgi:parallel beta-helix repeat protein
MTATAALIHYDDPTNTILLRKGAQTTLAGVSAVIGRADVLRELSPGAWLLAANLKIEAGAALRIAAPEVRWLKLRSDARATVWIKALGGQLEFADTCVSSWDESQGSYDENYRDGRSFVLARDGAHMTIRGGELRYLGYDGPGSYGVAWQAVGTTGEMIDSFVSYGYYGLYGSEVDGLLIRGNEVDHNVVYGIDLHTRALRLAIENNVAHDNGKHGIILAEETSDSLVRNNVVYNNLHHGIVIYQRSNNNLVEDNIAYGNGGHGIDINDAVGAMVRNNTVYDNLQAGIGLGQQSSATQVISNSVRANRKDGIALYSNATYSVLRDNAIGDNARYGVYIKSEGHASVEGNQIFGNAVGVYVNMTGPLEVSQQSNQIHDNREADLRRGSDTSPATAEGDRP